VRLFHSTFRSGLGLVACATLLAGSTISASALPAAPGDPRLGPHAREEAARAGLQLDLAADDSPAAAGRSPLTAAAPLDAGFHREVFGFAPYWELPGHGEWNLGLLSTIAYFGLDVRGDGSFDGSSAGGQGWNSRALSDIVTQAHQRGDRVVVTIKQFDEATINRIVTDQGSTQNAVTNTINAIAARGLDGVNVDFEGASSPSYPNLPGGVTHFMATLSDQVHKRWPGAEVSIDTYTGAASWDGGIFRIGDLAPHVDAFFVMAYDMSFSNMAAGHAGPNAPLTGFTYNDTTAVSQYLGRAPASKVILGVPYYGYKWSTQNDQLYGATKSGAAADPYGIVLSDIDCVHPRIATDGTSHTPWATWFSPGRNDPCGGNHNSWRQLYYDDAGSLGQKYDLVNGRGLRGAGIWALGYDSGTQDLWNVLAAKFH
jgi:hypothetical protein